MASLSEVVKELQGQNETLIDVSKTLTGMLKEDQEARKQRESDELKQAEEDIESRRRARVSPASGDRAKSFGKGVSKGLGLDTLMGGLRAMVGPFVGAMGGALGGLTLGGLLGMAVGKLFWGSVGAFLGSQLLNDEIVNKFIPDIIENINIGDNLKIGDVSSEIVGAFALLFGPKLIGAVLSKGFGLLRTAMYATLLKGETRDFIDADGQKKLDDETKKGKKRFGRRLIRGIGIGGLLAFVGTALGDEVKKLTGSEDLGSAISTAAQVAGIGALFFGPAGVITLALASLAVSGLSALGSWLRNKDKAVRDAAFKGMEKYNNMSEEELKNLSEDEVKDLRTKAAIVNQEANRAMQLAIGPEEQKRAAEALAAAQATVASLVKSKPDLKLQGDSISSLFAQLKQDPGNEEALDRIVSDLLMTGQTKDSDIFRYVGEFAREKGKGPMDPREQQELVNLLKTSLGYSDTTRTSRRSGAAQRERLRLRKNDSYLFTGPTEMMRDEVTAMGPSAGTALGTGRGQSDIEYFLRTGQFPTIEGIPAPTLNTPPINVEAPKVNNQVDNQNIISPPQVTNQVNNQNIISPTPVSVNVTPQAVVKQTITPEDVKNTNNSNVIVNNVDNSNNAKTVVNKGGDSPMYLGGSGMNAIDLRYERKHLGMLGFGSVVGNVF